MPESAAVVFDAFHNLRWRMRWDSLVRRTEVSGGVEHPSVGAVSENVGRGWMRTLSMRTRFLSYEPPRLAAAAMQGRSFPFSRWAASMRHKDVAHGESLLIYTYQFQATYRVLEPWVERVFNRQTDRRFRRLQLFLKEHGSEVRDWQEQGRPGLTQSVP